MTSDIQIQQQKYSQDLCPPSFEELLLELGDYAAQGQKELGSDIKRLVHLVRPDLEDLLSGSANDWFLDPMALLHFSAGQRSSGLDQIFSGYMQSFQGRPTTLRVRSGGEGHVYVPRLGYFATQFRNEWMTLTAGSDANGPHSVEFEGAMSPSSFTPS